MIRSASKNQRQLLLPMRFYLLLSLLLGQTYAVKAGSGLPDSTQFGYGVRVELYGQEVELALKTAASVGLDWISVDLDWELCWPDPGSAPNLKALDTLIQQTHRYGLNVLLSIKNAPSWAMTPSGPDPSQTAQLVQLLLQRYPHDMLTIELFPAANTYQGWGMQPNPKAYAQLLRVVTEALHSAGNTTTLIAGGLALLTSDELTKGIDDVSYLRELYQAGAAAYMPIVSLRLNLVSGDVLAPPRADQERVLRHYEIIRRVMSKAGHTHGLIWITAFGWPAGNRISPDQQSRWINQAYTMMRSQLYIGAAFLDHFNPPTGISPQLSSQYLIETGGRSIRLHPALTALSQMITLDRTRQAIPVQGASSLPDKMSWRSSAP